MAGRSPDPAPTFAAEVVVVSVVLHTAVTLIQSHGTAVASNMEETVREGTRPQDELTPGTLTAGKHLEVVLTLGQLLVVLATKARRSTAIMTKKKKSLSKAVVLTVTMVVDGLPRAQEVQPGRATSDQHTMPPRRGWGRLGGADEVDGSSLQCSWSLRDLVG